MATYTLETPYQDKLILDTLGARIELWLQDELILTKIVRGDGKIGSTHPCTPIFGPDRNNLYGLNQHGEMRNKEIKITNQTLSQFLISHNIDEANYPKGMKVIQKLELDKNLFRLEMSHLNEGNIESAVNFGEHCYFDAPYGYPGTKINGQDISQIISDNKDGVAIKLQQSNLIEIKGKSNIILEQNGFEFAMLWVGSNPELSQKDQNYICIEPVEFDPNTNFFGSEDSLIKPKESRSAWFSLQIKK